MKYFLMRRGAKHRAALLKRWGHACVVCGRGFTTIGSVTFEHLKPRHMGGAGMENVAPSHHVCNELRGSMSLVRAAAVVESVLLTRALVSGANGVESFLATPVPGRAVPFSIAVRYARAVCR